MSYDPSLPLQDSSYLPGERLEAALSGSVDSHLAPSSIHTMREYEDQLNSFKRENLNLKLRIYMMENAIGFHGNDEKNALKLNVDLRVENEELKKELSDRKDLLGQAYSTLSNFEEVYKSTESKVEALEEENERLRETNRRILCKAKRLTKGGDVDVGVDILEDAFGTLTEDDEPFFTNKMEDMNKQVLSLIFGEEVIPEDQEEILEGVRMKMKARPKESMMNADRNDNSTWVEIETWVESTNKHLMGNAMPDALGFKTYDDPVQSVKSALKKLSELGDVIKIKDQLLFRLEDELEQSKKSYDNLETSVKALKDSSLEMQRQCDHKSKEMESISKELETKAEKLTKSYEFCQSLTKALAEQKSLVEKFKKDLKARDGMIKKLTDEYNDLKAKFRAKSEFHQSHRSESTTTSSSKMSSGQVDEVIRSLSMGNSKEIRQLIKKFRDESMRKGCVAAMQCYRSRMKCIQKNVGSAVKLMRGRLQELADFLQRLLDSNDSNDEQRRLSKDFIETLQTSLSETRRLSASFLGDETSILNGSLQFGENIMDEIELAFNGADDSLETLLKECEELKTDLSSEDMQFFEGIQKEVVEKVLSSTSGSSSVEVQELKSSLEEERLLVEKMSEIQLELKKELDVVKEESELKTEEIERVLNELNVKASRIKDVEEKIILLTSRIEEYNEREGSLKSVHMEEVQALQTQLSESLASKNKLLGELEVLKDEKTQILQCCSENENLKEELRKAKEELESLNVMLNKDKAKRADIEKQMTKQLLKTRKVLKQTRQIGSEDSTDKEN